MEDKKLRCLICGTPSDSPHIVKDTKYLQSYNVSSYCNGCLRSLQIRFELPKGAYFSDEEIWDIFKEFHQLISKKDIKNRMFKKEKGDLIKSREEVQEQVDLYNKLILKLEKKNEQNTNEN